MFKYSTSSFVNIDQQDDSNWILDTSSLIMDLWKIVMNLNF